MTSKQPKYRIEQDNTLWIIKQGNKVLSHHLTLAEAQIELNAIVEDDRWHAANR